MLEQFKQIFLTSLKILQEKGDVLKDKVELFLNREAISIEEIAFFIMKHPDTEIKIKQLLGFTFQFYKLTIDNIFLSLDSKDDKVLEINITMNQEIIFQYRSYDNVHQLSDVIKIPSIVLEH